MMPASLRITWATRSTDGRAGLVLAAAIGAFSAGIIFSAATRGAGSQLAYWCSAVLTACLIGLDFPGTGHPRWSEFELSLPIAPIARARAQLLLSLGVWLSPSLVAFALNELGAFGAGRRLPLEVALVALGNATASVLFATALRHSLALRRSLGAALLRVPAASLVLAAAAARSPSFAAVVLLLAAPLFALAHRAALRTPELALSPIARAPLRAPRANAAGSNVARATFDAGDEAPTTFSRLALRYSAGSAYPVLVLAMITLWTAGITAKWLQVAASHSMLLAMLVVSHATWSARLLRLGHLPYPRERLFRYIAGPPLTAIVIGLGLALLLPAPAQLLRLRSDQGSATLSSPASAWRLTTGEPPLVTAPDGESHRPRARSVGLGSLLSAYDPYEAPRDASKAFQTHQLGRLLAEQRGTSLSPGEIEQRFAPGRNSYDTLSSDRYPELRDPTRLATWLVSAAALLLLALLVLHVAIRPGAALNPSRMRWDPPYLILFGLFMAAQVLQLFALGDDRADPLTIALARLGHPLTSNLLLTLPPAAALAALLYRSLLRRFLQMEPPPAAKAMDRWFIEI